MKNKLPLLVLIFSLFFLISCKNNNINDLPVNGGDIDIDDTIEKEENILINPIITMDKEYYVIGDKIDFILENYDDIDLFNIAFDTSNGVKIHSDGTISAEKVGNYTVTLSLKEDPSLYIALDFSIYKQSFELDLTTDTIAVGDKVEIWVSNFNGLYETKSDDFTYTVDNNDIATIKDNILTAKKMGTVNVIVTSKYNENVKQNIKVNVKDPSKDFMVRPINTLSQMQVGEILQIGLSKNYKIKDIDWKIENPNIIRATKYDQALEFTSLQEGNTKIIFYKKSNPSVSVKYSIKVNGTANIDFRSRLVNLAFSQVGIYEGKNPNGSYNNIQKYGAWYGNNGQPWCAMFVSWCWYHTGLSNDLLLKYQGCYTGKEWCEKKGIFKYKKYYTPKTGDIVFFLSNGASHTGIVAYCDGEYIYTIEGNRSNKVGIWRIKLTNNTITGYAVPNYPASSSLEDFSWIKNKQSNGTYLWTNVTSGDSTT